jgi:hypothetical protein
MIDRNARFREIAAKYMNDAGRISASAIPAIREEMAALPATYMVVAHPPVFLPGTERIESGTDAEDADRLARELSADQRYLKAWVYRDGVKIAEYGMGYKYDRFTS